jgi:hypothetical protein
MDKKKILLYAQAVLCILWAVLMAAAAVGIFRQGTAYQAQGHPEVWIYTREKAVAAFLRLLPLLLLAVAVNIAAVVLKVRDDKQDKPRALPYLTELYKAERAAEKTAGSATAESKTTEGDPAGGALKTKLKSDDLKSGKLRNIRMALLALAVVFIIAGVFNGSMEDMLIKAINICTECVGLG